jgi:purine-binding chemotaxis protein CheW
MDLVVFGIDDRRYALPATDVCEILRAVTIVPLPHAPRTIEGLIDVRGALVPVLDVRARFQHPPREPVHTDHLILARAGSRLVAIRADRALDVMHVEPGAVASTGAVAPDAGGIAGAARLADGLVLLHDLPAFLTAADDASLDTAMALRATEGAP